MQSSILTLLLAFFIACASTSTNLKTGDNAPDFRLKDGNGKLHTLSDYKGKVVALYFYPKDFTGGCTEQACDLRDNFGTLQDEGITILGVSSDDTTSHQEFAEEYDLPFTLLADVEKSAATAYGLAGPGTWLPKRVTFIIDGDGKILHIIDKVETGNHSNQILTLLGLK